MKIRLIRHATLWLEYGGQLILVDPMLCEAGANPPIVNSTNDRRNPLVSLPVPLETLLQPDLVIVTHLHNDHWDAVAASRLPKNIPLVCQPGDEKRLADSGFTNMVPAGSSMLWRSIRLHRIGGRHGTGEIGHRMGQVSGFVLEAEREPSLYITGDTIYCPEVEQALAVYKPDMTVLNAGGARFATGDPITMAADDVLAVCRQAPYTRVAAVHMEAINHCLSTRAELRARLMEEGCGARVHIPDDGEWIG